ncbi:hypothetical protein TPR58_20685 [Sphingomonas sp. HF-S3]|uniref:Uncharacterized protein n=1 Tax=Sphingomonas rustica TaxID=3103142 RepID=A0ABV0BED9_9SPHN
MEALWYMVPVLVWAAISGVLVLWLRRARRWLAVLLPIVAPVATLFAAGAYAEATITCSHPDCGQLMSVGIMSFAMDMSFCALFGAMAGVMLVLWLEWRVSGDAEARWILRRTFVPLVVAALAGAVLIVAWLAVQFEVRGSAADLPGVVLGFTMLNLIGAALTLAIIAPVVVMIRRRPRKPPIALAAIGTAGALGGLVVGSLTLGPQPLVLNLLQGLVTAATWIAFNRDVLKGAEAPRV